VCKLLRCAHSVTSHLLALRVQVVHANKEGDEDEEALELRKEASAAFAQFVGDAAALGDETANAQRGACSPFGCLHRRVAT
jgi:hypothetical protein